MPFLFPSNPNINELSTQNSRQYIWTGYAWELISSPLNLSGISGILVLSNETGYDISSSGLAFLNDANFNNLSVNGTIVSVSGHNHISSDISDFTTTVSGLLPSITGVDYINTNFSNNIYSIGVSGLQPSGDYANSIHTHVSNDITDFNSSVSGLLPVLDISSGTGIYITNLSGVYNINSTGSGVLSDQSKSLVTTVFNETGSEIPKMTAVYINGGHGDRPTIALAIATGDTTSAGTYGITYETISNMQEGKVIVFGALTGLDTDQFNPTAPQGNINGTVLYLSPTVSGALTTIKPIAPNHIVTIGTVVRTHQNEGIIEVRIQNGYELEELHNVAISGVNSGQFLQYNGSGLWVPSSSGNFSTLLVNNLNVSVSGHNHIVSDLTDFNSGVSGLLPSISGSGYITSSFSNNNYIIGVTGLQPSGNYSLVGHTHTSSDITNFNSSVSGLLPVTNIIGDTNIGVSVSGTVYTVGVSGVLSSANLPVIIEKTQAIGNSGGTTTLSLSTGSFQTITLSASCVFTMPAATAGASITLVLTQGSNYTATFTGVKWPNGSAPTITATANAIDILVFVSDGTNWYGTISQKFS